MEEVKTHQQASREILDMRRGEQLSFKINERDSARLWLLQMQLVSMNNLYASYVQRYGKPEGNLNFDKLLEQYVQKTADYTVTLQNAVLEQLGEELYSLLSNPANGYSYFYESGLGAVCLVKNCPLPCLANKAE